MIYLDHHATTPLRPEVFETMLPFLTERWGNSSSSYAFGSSLNDGKVGSVHVRPASAENDCIVPSPVRASIQTRPSFNSTNMCSSQFGLADSRNEESGADPEGEP